MTQRQRARKVAEQINKYNDLAKAGDCFSRTFLAMRDTWIKEATEYGFRVLGTTLKGYRVRLTARLTN